jgi:hypothetical protein
MGKVFNITGACIPSRHFMVDISEKISKIQGLIDNASYFIINRGRQYGKTTTLLSLLNIETPEYEKAFISFEGLGSKVFESEKLFCQEFIKLLSSAYNNDNWIDSEISDMSALKNHITKMSRGKKLILMIDEVDKASNFYLFLDFLGMLRSKFLERSIAGMDSTFHNVILAGVYDIKNIKFSLNNRNNLSRSRGAEVNYNSPWNIAENFDIEMFFNVDEIKTMLDDYENYFEPGMNSEEIAKDLFYYTSGYPVLVSSICKIIHDNNIEWSKLGVIEAVKVLLKEKEKPLFDSLSQNLENNEKVYKLLYDVLLLGEKRTFSIENPTIALAYRYGYINEIKDKVVVSNKIFERRLMDYFISKDEENSAISVNNRVIDEITKGERFNMSLCLEIFSEYWEELYSDKDDKFYEKHCRLIFLAFLKPILNGIGFYFIESAFTDDRRMDVVVVYNGEQHVLELKIWKGQRYNDDGVEQLLNYMKKLRVEKGYLLTFDFRKNPAVFEPAWIRHSDLEVFEVRV